jgi:hypothetical protein
VRWDFVASRALPGALFLTFLAVCVDKFVYWAATGQLAVDLRIYRAAAGEALRGGNPWAVFVDGYHFAAPPPSLIPYFPAALLPEDVATVAYALVFSIASILAVRALRLPIWWVLFPPLFESILDLNADVLVLALLLGGQRVGGAAVLAKVYAVIPLLLQGRWRGLAVGMGLVLLSAPWWPTFFEQRETIVRNLANQAGSLSAWGTWLMVPTVVALSALGRRDAAWLAVPALWPSTQLHYATVALPAMRRRPLLAFLFCFAIPLLPAVAVIAEAVRVLLVDRVQARRSPEPDLSVPPAT